jgi:predicted nucleic acid-binding Zn ribbon protein
MQKFSDRPLTKCPQCGGKLSKLMSMNSFQLKGGGWYVTDYAKKGDKVAPKTEAKTESAAPAAAGGEKPADKPAKPAAETTASTKA